MNDVIFVDKKFSVEHTVIVKLWDKKNLSLFNHYQNLGWKLVCDDSEKFQFEKTFDNIQNAVTCFIIQQGVYDVDCVISCEYCYEDKVLATEFIENVDVAFRNIADKKYMNDIKAQQMEINDLESEVEMLKPLLSLPKDEIKHILKYIETKYGTERKGA